MFSKQNRHLGTFRLISPGGNAGNDNEHELEIFMEKDQFMTPSELEAKNFVMNMMKNGTSVPYDKSEDGSTVTAALPQWYDEQKFGRGQKYFLENRFGVLTSNVCGLIMLLSDPATLDILDSTKRSSAVDTAKKRYVSTLMTTLSWYEGDLHPGSKLWESLSKIRRMHLLASNNAIKKKIGKITQLDMVRTAFGFMGFPLVRPYKIGVRCDNKEDREGFIHFWAVIIHMLGVEEQFNMCLFTTETVEHICAILLRYFFLPLIQLETVKFKEMANALLNGLSSFLPHMSYDTVLFCTKRIIGVPGYQYRVDMSKETLCRQIFSAEELNISKKVIRSMYPSHYSKMYEIIFNDAVPVVAQANVKSIDTKSKSPHNECVEICGQKFNWIERSNDGTEWRACLNDSAFYALSKWDQLNVRWICFVIWCYANLKLARHALELGSDLILFLMRRFHNST